MLDLILRNATVVDGTGAPARRADVGIAGDRIAAVGEVPAAAGRRAFDVAGQVVSPGFIDLHTHSDFSLLAHPRAPSLLRQGVTTQVTGNCGLSPFPVGDPEHAKAQAATLGEGLAWDWDGAGEFAARLEALPLAGNVALLVGHGAVRAAVMGLEDREPSSRELAQMRRLVDEAMEAGAFGLSTGLVYAPGRYAAAGELVELTRVAARRGGYYATHVRDEGGGLLGAVGEALAVARTAGAPLQLSHHKAVGRRHWGLVRDSLQMIDDARRQGHDVLADAYPYTMTSTDLASVLPRWASSGGPRRVAARLADGAHRRRVREAMTEASAAGRGRDLDGVILAGAPDGPLARHAGRRLRDIAAEQRVTLIDAALDVLAHAGSATMVDECLSEADVRQVLAHPAVAVASDGMGLADGGASVGHPRSYGTFPRVLAKYVRAEGVLGLEQAVHKMTGLPARRLGLPGRGTIRAGHAADLVVFDQERVRDEATVTDPARYSSGLTYVLVGGAIVIDGGADTGALAGRVLRRGERDPRERPAASERTCS